MVLNTLRPLVLSGPSGVGKGTLLKRLFAEFPDKFGFSVSHTTRAPRPGEIDGREYHFVAKEKFEDLIRNNAFIEWAQYSGNYYGTSIQTVRDVGATGRRCVLDIDAQGVRSVKKTDLSPVYVFISPPSRAALIERLRGRATDTEEAIQKRTAASLEEIRYAQEPNTYDYIIVNDDLDRAYAKFKQIALGEAVQGDETLPPLTVDS